MATLQQWIDGARPRTLPAAFAPVIAGTAVAGLTARPSPGLALLALVVAVSLQVGVNYANDYSDGIRGTDAERVGPVRLVGQGLAHPSTVKFAAMACFGAAMLVGLALVALTETWVLLLVGLLAIVAAWFYTGGSRPYGYAGWGEVMVFVFFGLVATLGSQYVQHQQLTVPGLLAAVGVGAIAAAILVANNLRDIPTDTLAGKRTLAVRLGDRGARVLWVGLIVVSVVCVGVMFGWGPWLLLGLLAVPVVAPAARQVIGGATGRDLIPTLVGTGRYELAYAVALALGVIVQVWLA